MRSISAAAEWGLPDWRGVAYGAVKSWNENRWRWEFTRRRKDYRMDFDRHADESYAHAIELYKTFKPDGKRIAVSEILKPSEPGFKTTMPGPMKYGLAGLPNPRISDQPSYATAFQPTYGGLISGEGKGFLTGGEDVSIDLPEGMVAVTFDLALEIGPQVKWLQSQLEVQQQLVHGKIIKRRKHPRTWLQYLRVLDGRESGASLSDMAEIIIAETTDTPTPQAAKVMLNAAQSLMFNWPA